MCACVGVGVGVVGCRDVSNHNDDRVSVTRRRVQQRAVLHPTPITPPSTHPRTSHNNTYIQHQQQVTLSLTAWLEYWASDSATFHRKFECQIDIVDGYIFGFS